MSIPISFIASIARGCTLHPGEVPAESISLEGSNEFRKPSAISLLPQLPAESISIEGSNDFRKRSAIWLLTEFQVQRMRMRIILHETHFLEQTQAGLTRVPRCKGNRSFLF